MSLLLPAVVLLAAAASQDRSVGAFHSVSLSGGVRATLSKAKAPSLKLTGDTEDLAKVETLVKDGQLFVRPKAGTLHMGTVTADIGFTALDALEASGGVIAQGDGVSGGKCTMSVSGGVQLDLKGVTCDSLTIEASGGAGVKLTGASKKLTLNASGGVQLETRALDVSEAKVSASGGVSGGIAVADALDASLSGGVSLKVKGHPKVSRADTTGSAKLSYE